MSYIALTIAIYVLYLCAKYAFRGTDNDNGGAHHGTYELPSGGGYFGLEAVGESHYTHAIALIDKRHGQKGQATICPASLVLDSANKHDKNAVRVVIDRLTVGYLSREDALRYRQHLKQAGREQATGQCRSKVTYHGEKIWSVRLDVDL